MVVSSADVAECCDAVRVLQLHAGSLGEAGDVMQRLGDAAATQSTAVK